MDIEVGLISKISSKEDIILLIEEGLNSAYFEKYGDVFDFIREHFSEYGVAPEISTVEKKFNFDIIETEQPIKYFIAELKERKKLNLYKAGLLKIVPLVGDGKLKEVETQLQRLVIDTQKFVKSTKDIDIRGGIEERLELYKQRQQCAGIDGYSTPWDYLNSKLLGYHPGDLVMTIAKPKSGKSWLLVYQAHHIWKVERAPVVFVTKEMTTSAIRQRFDAIDSKLTYDSLRKGLLSKYEEEKYFKRLEEIDSDEVPFIILGYGLDDDTSTVSSLIPKIENYLMDGGVLFVDGIYLLEDDRRAEKDWQRVVNIAKDLKMLALRYNIPIVATTQAQTGDKSYVPEMHNIAYGTYIAQYVDALLSQSQNPQQLLAEMMFLNVLAQREGNTGSFPINFKFDPINFEQKDMITLEDLDDEDNEFL